MSDGMTSAKCQCAARPAMTHLPACQKASQSLPPPVGKLCAQQTASFLSEKSAGFFGSLIYDNSCRGASPAFQPAGWPLRRRRSGGDEIAPPINDIRKRHGAKNAPKDQRTPSRRGRVSAYRGDHRSTVYTYIDKERGYDLSLYNQHVKKPRRVSRPQTRKQYNLFSAATCAWQKTLCAE